MTSSMRVLLRAPRNWIVGALWASLAVAACGSDGGVGPGDRTHPNGVLGTPTPVTNSPFGIAVRHNGQIVVAQLTGDGVAVLPDSGGSFTHIAGGSGATDVATARGGAVGFVANQLDGEIGRLNLETLQQVTSIPMNMATFRVVRAPGGGRFYVTGNTSAVKVVNASSGAILDSIIMEPDQNGVAESPDGDMVYISSMTAGVVREVTKATGVAGRSLAIGGTAQEVVVSEDGTTLFVAVESSLYVQVWDLASGVKTDSILVGAGTFGMALSPDGERLYATSSSDGEVYIIDPVARALLTTLPVGGTPRRVAFNAAGTLAVIANEAGWVDFIN